MTLFISLVVFAISVYLFILTNYKIRSIKENVLIEDVRKEMEALITEFNGAASRNIEMMEDAIGRMQEIMRRSGDRISQLDERIHRAGMPVVVEKIVEKPARRLAEPKKKPAKDEEPDLLPVPEGPKKKSPKPARDAEDGYASFLEETILAQEEVEPVLPLGRDARSEDEPPAVPAQTDRESKTATTEAENGAETRSERLKSLLRAGRSKEELVAMGFVENEINLMRFLVGK